MWTFLACPNPGGGKPIDRFVSELAAESVNNLSAVMELLSSADRKYWNRPQFDVLNGYPGMGEIRFNGNGKTYRIFGFFGPGRLQFTLLVGAEKKRSLKAEMDLAYKRKKFAESSPELLYEFEF